MTSQKIEIPVEAGRKPFPETDSEFKFAAAVANFGMQLRQSQYRGDWTYSDIDHCKAIQGEDRHGFRGIPPDGFGCKIAHDIRGGSTPYLESTPQPGYTWP